LDIGYNKLEVDTADSCVDTADPDWKETQTVPPTSVAATPRSAAEVQLTWNPIAYVQDGGRYNVWGKAQNEADYTLMASTTNKTSAEVVVSGLQPGTTYEFVVRTFTSAHDEQQSNLISVDSDVVTAVTESTLLFLPLITNAAP
ncbi:MAG: fibronectin type III domain-containing protein, partial [Anaerolineales bacterium]|nr:fibronectin type III domain-containing protein [Anaerolineales bacterium]